MVRSLLAPAILGGFLIASLCFVEGLYLKDRWGKPGAEAAAMGERFKNVPKQIGGWEGEDLPVDDQVKNTAGAVNYVSRRYKNEETGGEVRLWLIVGHSRDICRHTPNICYPSSGFRQDGLQIHQRWTEDGGKEADFFTSKFIKDDVYGRHAERVFWAWNHPDKNVWQAPADPRQHYGLSRALYKVYFTANVPPNEAAAEDSVALEFAKLMLPEVDKALFPQANSGAVALVDAEEEETEAAANEADVDITEVETAEPAETAAE